MFNSLIGQDALKRKLSFYLSGHKAHGFSPFLLFKGPKGSGKTNFAREYARQLKKPLLELNCATIKNEKQFFEQIFVAVLVDAEITVLFDECHNLPMALQEQFLTILNTEKTRKVYLERDGSTFEFNFEKLTFLFATTEYDQIFGPLKTRMTPVDFIPYTEEELGKIINKHIDWVKFEDGVLTEIAQTVRNNPRTAVLMSRDIGTFLNITNKSKFTLKDWEKLSYQLDIKRFGLSSSEITVLRLLQKHGPCTLNMLAAMTGESRSSLQRDTEFYLLKMGLVRIDGTRQLTTEGLKYLHELDK